MRRGIITWSVVLVVVLSGFGITVLALNSTLYSPTGFVRSYLDALARRDATGALELAGAVPSGDASAELLTRATMGTLTDIALVSDTIDGGVHRVVYSYRAEGVTGRSSFDVVRSGEFLGFFDRWSFVTSPLGVIRLTVQHDDRFIANGVALRAPVQDDASPYLIFVPGGYALSHDSTWLTASTVVVTATAPGGVVRARVDAEANATFIAEVQSQLASYLDQCASQQALLPTGCPFGQTINNRITSAPAWSIVTFPAVTLTAAAVPGQWIMPPTPGVAHLVVDVKSLFDGSISTLNADSGFELGYRVELHDDQLTLTPQYP